MVQLSVKTLKIDNSNIKKVTLDMFSIFVLSSRVTRDLMWDCGDGPFLLMYLLDLHPNEYNAKILEALVNWLQLDTDKISTYLMEDNNLS